MFIPLLAIKKNSNRYRARLTYFLVQRTASLILIFRIFNREITNILQILRPKNLILIALIIKITRAPLHSWLIPVAVRAEKTNLWLVLTIQKLIPLIILIFSKPNLTPIIVVCILLSISLGSITNFSQNNIKRILAYSRITNAGWFLATIRICQEGWVFYFLSYRVLILAATKLVSKNLIQQYINNNQTNNITTLLTLLRLGGLPPFLGFFPKVIILNSRISSNLILIALAIVIFSVLDLFIYTRVSYFALLNKKSHLLWIKKEKYFSFFILVIRRRLFSIVIIM